MLTYDMGGGQKLFCDGMNRRNFLKVGALSFLGLSLTDFLQLREAAAKGGREKSCIFIWLQGGPSHIDMFDLKPDAPAEFRGQFNPIKTNVAGVEVSEHLPMCAQVADLYAILRSINHPNAGHEFGAHYLQTGVLPRNFNANLKPNNIHPSFGSVVAKELGRKDALPPYICLPSYPDSSGPSFLGSAFAPFVIGEDPSDPSFKVRDVDLPRGVDDKRIDERRRLLKGVDRLQRKSERVQTMSVFSEKAYNLVTSPAAKKAFDISAESDKMRDAYGWNPFGQSCLLARRLVEAGARFVTVEHGNWDNHGGIFPTLKDDLLPVFDRGFATLLTDLKERGLLESTLVVVTGEFGRTPRLNKDAGRDHWPNAMSVVLAGGGIKGGQAVGETDAHAESVKERPISPEDVAATIYSVLGVDYKKLLHTPLGRPVPIVDGGESVRELF